MVQVLLSAHATQINNNDDDKDGDTSAALIHSCVLSAEIVLKLVKPFAHTNKPPEAPQRRCLIYLLCQFLSLHRVQLQDMRGFREQAVLTMKVFVVLQGLITATLLSGKSGEGRKG